MGLSAAGTHPECTPPLAQRHAGEAPAPYPFGPDKVVEDGWMDEGEVRRRWMKGRDTEDWIKQEKLK